MRPFCPERPDPASSTSDADVEDDLDRVDRRGRGLHIEAAWGARAAGLVGQRLTDYEVASGRRIYRDPDAGDWLTEKADEDRWVVAFRWYPLANDELPDEYADPRRGLPVSRSGGVAIHVEESAQRRSPTTVPRPARRK